VCFPEVFNSGLVPMAFCHCGMLATGVPDEAYISLGIGGFPQIFFLHCRRSKRSGSARMLRA
jgi:hypothetical protein